MKLKYAFKFMFVLFCVITTFQILFICLINFMDDNVILMTTKGLLRIPFVSFAGVLPTLIFVFGKDKNHLTGAAAIIMPALHFALTAGIVFGLLIYYGWMDAANAAFIIAFFLAIYVSAYVYQGLRDRKLAKQLNERINAFHGAENETRRNEP